MRHVMSPLDLTVEELEQILNLAADIKANPKKYAHACDGKKLGYIVDFVFDEKCGQIEAIIIPKTSKFCNFFCDGSEYIIPYKCICKIGPDVILVEMHEKK